MFKVKLAVYKEKLKALMAKKYTFIFVPDVTGKFMRFSVPKAVIHGMGGVAVAMFFLFTYFSLSIIKKSEDLGELRDLRSVTASQKLEIQQFNQKMKLIETQLARLEKFDRKLRVITALEKQSPSSTEFGLGGPGRDDMDLTGSSQKLTHSVLDSLNTDLDRVKQMAENQELSFFELDEFFKEQSALFSHTPSIWPARGFITSNFGYRRSPFTGMRELHEGLDIATQANAPVLAPASGVVINAGFNPGYGNVLEIDHGYGVVSRYGHAAKVTVNIGQRVKRGDTVALVGSTGRSTGPHLHYEVRLNGVPVNPYRYILED
ncbi:MAG: M23 family metallopeptidase [Nitrospinae bacterium]|nr:M23 family metallopeptidase [Nitrospinota bacterium]